MPLHHPSVSLSDILEVRCGFITEDEIWALVCSTVEALQDELMRGSFDTGFQSKLSLSTKNLLICGNGRVSLSEFNNNLQENFKNKSNVLNDVDIEFQYVYSIGLIFNHIIDYNSIHHGLQYSKRLTDLLKGMCKIKQNERYTFSDIMLACSENNTRTVSNLSNFNIIINLFKVIYGDGAVDKNNPIFSQSTIKVEAFKESCVDPDTHIHNDRNRYMRDRVSHQERSDIIDNNILQFQNSPHLALSERTFREYTGVNEPVSGPNYVPYISKDERQYNELVETYRRIKARQEKLKELRYGLQYTCNIKPDKKDTTLKPVEEIIDFRQNKRVSYSQPSDHTNHSDFSPKNIVSRDHVDHSDLSNKMKKGLNTSQNNVSEMSVQVMDDDFSSINSEDNYEENLFSFDDSDLINNAVKLRIPQAKLKSESRLCSINVVLLNGSEIEVFCHPTNTGHQLFNTLITYLHIKEFMFFGIAAIKNKEIYFIDDDTKLQKVAPSQWKNGHHSETQFCLYFRMKFYPNNINLLKDPVSIQLLYQQLKLDFSQGKLGLNLTHEKLLFLISFCLQAEFGNVVSTEKLSFDVDSYVSKNMLKQYGIEYIRLSLQRMREKLYKYSKSKAKYIFICYSQTLPEYGIHFYAVSNEKKSFSYNLDFGICFPGIIIAAHQGNTRVVLHRHLWQNIEKISFSNHKFSILPKSEYEDKKTLKSDFYTDSYRKGRYLLQFCAAHHSFKMKLDQIFENFSSNTMIINPHQKSLGTQNSNNHMKFSSNPSLASNTIDNSSQNSEQLAEFESCYDELSHKGSHKSLLNSTSLSMAGFSSNYSTLPLNHEEIVQFDNSVEDNLKELSTDPNLKVIELPKNVNTPIGLTIASGHISNTSTFGIFVKSIEHNSLADSDGRIKVNDQLIAVNGQNVKELSHAEVIHLIRNSAHYVQLLLLEPVGMEVNFLENLQAADNNSRLPINSNDNLKKDNSHSLHVRHDSLESYESSDSDTMSPSDNSDLDIETVMPSEVLKSSYVQNHMSPAMSPIHLKIRKNHTEKTLKNSFRDKNRQSDGFDFNSDDEMSFVGSYREIQANSNNNLIYSSSGRSIIRKPSDTSSNRESKMFEMYLKKVNNSFGFNIIGGNDTGQENGSLYINSLSEGGPAHLNGNVQIGDKLMSINGQSLVNISHRQAVDIMRSSPQKSCIVLSRS